MKKEELFRAIGSVDGAQVLEAENAKRRPHWHRYAALAACLCLIIAAAAALPRGVDNTANTTDQGAGDLPDGDPGGYDTSQGDQPGNMIHSPDYTGPTEYSSNVDIGQLDSPPPASNMGMDTSACLAWLEPEELFAMDTVIFRGTVEELRYYEVSGGYRAYFTVASVAVSEIYRGDLTAGEAYTIYLPVAPGVSVSTAGDLENLEVGSEAIFMPRAATADTGITSGDSYFCYADVADFWFDEGIRFLFLETADGLSYASDVYDLGGDGGEVTLDDAAAYIREMLAVPGDVTEPTVESQQAEGCETVQAALQETDLDPASHETVAETIAQVATGAETVMQGHSDGGLAIDYGEWRPRDAWSVPDLPNSEPRWNDSEVLTGQQESSGLCGYPRADAWITGACGTGSSTTFRY